METNNHVGIWNFSKSTELEKIKDISEYLAKDDHYLYVRIRRTSEDTYGIEFEYSNKDHKTQEDFHNYLNKTSEMVKEKVGQGLVGWNISSSYYKIK